jgi:hypothetical protein
MLGLTFSGLVDSINKGALGLVQVGHPNPSINMSFNLIIMKV